MHTDELPQISLLKQPVVQIYMQTNDQAMQVNHIYKTILFSGGDIKKK